MHDGIAVGDIAHSDLGVAIANDIVRSILDGTYKDVHSVLLYQRGKLVLEEYFYGYSVERHAPIAFCNQDRRQHTGGHRYRPRSVDGSGRALAATDELRKL